MLENKKIWKLFKCWIFGHYWLHKRTLKETVLSTKERLHVEIPYNIWKCNYCNTIVKTPLKKNPNNDKRKTIELINEIITKTIR